MFPPLVYATFETRSSRGGDACRLPDSGTGSSEAGSGQRAGGHWALPLGGIVGRLFYSEKSFGAHVLARSSRNKDRFLTGSHEDVLQSLDSAVGQEPAWFTVALRRSPHHLWPTSKGSVVPT